MTFWPYLFCADIQGSDNAIPLSPQWLLNKPGESKAGMGTGVCLYCLCVHFVFFFSSCDLD